MHGDVGFIAGIRDSESDSMVPLSSGSESAEKPCTQSAPIDQLAADWPNLRNLLSVDFLDKIDDLAASFGQNQPCAHISVENFLSPDFCDSLVREFPACDQDVIEKFRANNMRGGKSKKQNILNLGQSFEAFDSLIRSQEFLDILGKITGIEDLIYDPDYYGGGTHESLNGERLLPHIDYNYHPKTGFYRRLNLLVYLNSEWCQEWGGELELHSNPLDRNSDQIVSCPVAKNNCTILETTSSSWHGFPVIELPPDKRNLSRKSIAVYYYTANPPSSDTALNRSTVYVSEPLSSRFEAGRVLTETDLLSLRELWQMRSNLSRELQEEIICHGYEFLYYLNTGDALDATKAERLRLIFDKIERVSDYLQAMHLALRNPEHEREAMNASWLRITKPE